MNTTKPKPSKGIEKLTKYEAEKIMTGTGEYVKVMALDTTIEMGMKINELIDVVNKFTSPKK